MPRPGTPSISQSRSGRAPRGRACWWGRAGCRPRRGRSSNAGVTSSRSTPTGARGVSPPPPATAAAAAPQPIRAECRVTPPGGEGLGRLMNAPANSTAESNPGDLLLVTGASGFVGSAISNAARAAGYRVRVLVRRSSPRTNIAPSDEVAVGDICDRASLVAALRGVRYLAHAAADYRLWSPAPDEIIRTNVEGTRGVMEEALRAGV